MGTPNTQSRLPIVLSSLALIVAVAGVGGPAIAKQMTANSHKVDGLHAVKSGASVKARKGKLVATSKQTGRLPNNIIAKAPNADKVDGLDSAELELPSVVPPGRTVYGYWNTYHNGVTGLNGHALSYPIPMPSTLTARVLSPGESDPGCTGSSYAPTAAPGYLCLYLTDAWTKPSLNASSRFGVNLYEVATGSGTAVAHVIWAATAPLS